MFVFMAYFVIIIMIFQKIFRAVTEITNFYDHSKPHSLQPRPVGIGSYSKNDTPRIFSEARSCTPRWTFSYMRTTRTRTFTRGVRGDSTAPFPIGIRNTTDNTYPSLKFFLRFSPFGFFSSGRIRDG
jgi:hypothetical protein